MKKLILFFGLLCLTTGLATAQGTFVNLDFEAATVPYSTNFGSLVPATAAFPGWTVSYGGTPQSSVAYNGLQAAGGIYLWAREFSAVFPIPTTFGSFSMIPAPRESMDVSLSQVGMIPLGTSFLRFEDYSETSLAPANFRFRFGSTLLPVELVSQSGFVSTWQANLAGLSGQTDELWVTLATGGGSAGVHRLDNLQFVTIPEPGTWTLLGLGGALLWSGVRWRKK